jgi:hypothetical protein
MMVKALKLPSRSLGAPLIERPAEGQQKVSRPRRRSSLPTHFVVICEAMLVMTELRPPSARFEMGRKRKSLHALTVRLSSSTKSSSYVTPAGSEPVDSWMCDGLAAFQSRLTSARLKTLLEGGQMSVDRAAGDGAQQSGRTGWPRRRRYPGAERG